jgi:16S rRNA pseudouridine516 synthase
MRLDRMLSQATGLSRKEVKQLLKTQQVLVNNVLITNAGYQLTPEDEVRLAGDLIEQTRLHYFMLHKPLGYVCSHKDAHHPIVPDLFSEQRFSSLQMVGRLDVDTSGLLLLTDDGQWNHALMSPRRHCNKTYKVTTQDPIHPETHDRFAKGIILEGDDKPTRPAHLTLTSETEATITLSEGRYHQVKRMFAATGNHVTSLHRVSIAELELDPTLQPGEYRVLSDFEHQLLNLSPSSAKNKPLTT